jgi:predicted 3-demethylubiquinone-9 3-methyltransferase (glyoxalase superfamily)
MDKNAKQNIYPCILFNDEASSAAQFYVETFHQSKILVEVAAFTLFEIGGYKFKAINTYKTNYKSNPAFSFMVSFDDEKDLEATWRKLKIGGIVIMPLSEHEWSPKYGWIQDQFGISWHLLISESTASKFQKISPVLV